MELVFDRAMSKTAAAGLAGRMRRANANFRTFVGLAQCFLIGACQSGQGAKVAEAPSAERLEYVTQFKKIDTAGKGHITLDQANAYYTTLFAELDRNRDGYLDARELEPLIPIMGAKSANDLLAKLDRNSDNRVSRGEFLVISNWLFQLARNPKDMQLEEALRNVPPSLEPPKKPTLFGN
jgi:hypothetical protein